VIHLNLAHQDDLKITLSRAERRSHQRKSTIDSSLDLIGAGNSLGGGGGNREPAKLAMRIADEHSSSAREPGDGEPNPSDPKEYSS